MSDLAVFAIIVAVISWGAVGFLAWTLYEMSDSHDRHYLELQKLYRDERVTLLNRIQRPDYIPPSPDAVARDPQEVERRRRLQSELRSVGTVQHGPEAP